MKDLLEAFFVTRKCFKQDRIIVLLSLIPILLGVLTYWLMGSFLFNSLLPSAQQWIEKSLTSAGWSSIFYYLLVAFLSAALFFIINWTFILLISFLSSPFNDLIVGRVRKRLYNIPQDSFAKGFSVLLKKIVVTVLNEIKKISFILIITIFAALLSFIPVLSPITFFLSALLLSIGFLDYSWSKNELSFKECCKDLKVNIWKYFWAGALFMFLISIPILNLFILPFAIVYFAVLFFKGQQK